jgi:hypothetical protein
MLSLRSGLKTKLHCGKLMSEDERKLFDMTPGSIKAFFVEDYVTSEEDLAKATNASVPKV